MKKKYLMLLIFVHISSIADVVEKASLHEYKSNKTHFIPNPKKNIVLNFWASWCTSCIKEIATLELLKEKYPEYEYIALNAGDNHKKIKRFLKKHPWSYTVLMDEHKTYVKKLGILNLPQTWVIQKDGTITYKGTTPPIKLY